MSCLLLLHIACFATAVPLVKADPEMNNATYDPNWSRSIEGYGVTWMYMPDGDGVPRVAILSDGGRSTTSPSASDLQDGDVEFRLFTRKNPNKGQLLRAADESTVLESNFDPSKPTKFVTHGWQSSAQSAVVTGITQAYLKVLDCNVVAVDWSTLASDSFYIFSKGSTDPVGGRVADLIRVMSGNGKASRNKKKINKGKGNRTIPKSDLELFHLLGHSLGAHVMGFAGAHLRPLQVARITGMDPAGPLFHYQPNGDGTLDKSDGQFVDVIHTSGGSLGYQGRLGHVDFYPNGGGAIQPGCCCVAEFIEACSHGRSYEYFIESITTTVGFEAVECNSLENFNNGSCANGRTTVMGDRVDTSARGMFYLSTNSQSPYARGARGLTARREEV